MDTSGELWRQCANWLTRCKILREDHKANWTQSSISDLAYTLRDGVLLCHLLNNLDPGCIDMKEVNHKPQMAQFLCLRNIKFFLQNCRDYYGIRESDLFDPPMLFDLTNFHRVLCTLSKLSQCPKVLQQKNIPGFSAHPERSESQEDIYKHLQSNAEGHVRGARTFSEEENFSDYSRVKDEETYQDLCSINRSTLRQSQQLAGAVQSLEKRDYVIKELVDTESNYCEVLVVLVNKFMKPLSSLMQAEDHKRIFSRVKELCDIHADFLNDLRRATANDSDYKLSEVFMSWKEKFLIYGEYCANLTKAQDILREVTSNDEIVNQQVNRCQKEHSGGRIQLRDVLSVPMQRVLKYPLLLDKLVSETSHSHPDYRGLERSKEAMVDVAQYINEVKRDSELFVILSQIQDGISELSLPEGSDLKNYGRLLMDGELKIKAHDDQKMKTRYVFIFDRIMILCKNSKVGDSQYSYRNSLPLNKFRVDDQSSTRRILNKESRWCYQWYLVEKSSDMRSKGEVYTLYARTEEKKESWKRALQQAMDTMEPPACKNTDHKFSLKTFDKPTVCQTCTKFLKGSIFQGYRCETCGIAVHKDCIACSGRCLPPPPPPPPTQPGDRHLAEYLWFVGEMGRDLATSNLDRRMDGTYLLRVRPLGPTHPNETPYALSLKTDDKVKHMKVYKKNVDSTPHYYLSEARYFRSVVDLVAYYERTSLGENFVGLNVSLQWPYRRIVVVAEYNFTPVETNQLPLVQGSRVVVLSKEGDERGWWRGRCRERVGFFPRDYVREEEVSVTD